MLDGRKLRRLGKLKNNKHKLPTGTLKRETINTLTQAGISESPAEELVETVAKDFDIHDDAFYDQLYAYAYHIEDAVQMYKNAYGEE